MPVAPPYLAFRTFVQRRQLLHRRTEIPILNFKPTETEARDRQRRHCPSPEPSPRPIVGALLLILLAVKSIHQPRQERLIISNQPRISRDEED